VEVWQRAADPIPARAETNSTGCLRLCAAQGGIVKFF
jgi:hypothetical protein